MSRFPERKLTKTLHVGSVAVGGEAVEDLVGGFVPYDGLGSSFQVVIQVRMAAVSSAKALELRRAS